MPELGIRYDFRCPEICPVSVDVLYETALEQCEWADKLGFSSVTLSEHHGSEDSYLPSLVSMGSAIAARTENINILFAAVIAPLHDPLRLAEDIAVLDNISKGRISIVVANGYVASELEMFGKEMKDRVKLVTEAVEVLKSAWSGKVFEYHGRQARITPKPYQNPRPAILLGGASEKAARRAAQIADGFLPTMPQFYDTYREELKKLNKPDPGPMPKGAGMYLHIAEDPDSVWSKVAPHALHEMNSYGQWAAESGSETGYQPIDDAEVLKSLGQHNIWTPQEAIEKLSGLGAVNFHPLMGGLDPALSWENLHLFEKEVLPQLG